MELVGGAIAAAGGVAGAAINARAVRQANHENMQMQREFAENGIAMRVADAKRAGIHPLAALGVSQMQAPVSLVDTSWGDAARNMGQDISRAYMATRTESQRRDELLQEQINHQKKLNTLLDFQIQDRQNQNQPPMPSPFGTGLSNPTFYGPQSSRYGKMPMLEPPLKWKSVETAVRGIGDPTRAAGDLPWTQFAATPTGLKVIPSQDIKNSLEDFGGMDFDWTLHNRALPLLHGKPAVDKPSTKEFPMRPGTNFRYWNPWMGEWQDKFVDPKRLEGLLYEQSVIKNSGGF